MYAISRFAAKPLSWTAHIHMTGFWMNPEKRRVTPPKSWRPFLTQAKSRFILALLHVSGQDGRKLGIVRRRCTNGRPLRAARWAAASRTSLPYVFVEIICLTNGCLTSGGGGAPRGRRHNGGGPQSGPAHAGDSLWRRSALLGSAGAGHGLRPKAHTPLKPDGQKAVQGAARPNR